jgi:hypothetical protein
VEETLVNATPHIFTAEAWQRDLARLPDEQPYDSSASFYLDTEQDVEIFSQVYTQTEGPSAIQWAPFASGFLGAMVQVFNANGVQKAVYHSSDNGSHALHLLPGNYRVVATATAAGTYALIRLTYRTFSGTPLKHKPAGGVRVRKTRLYDGLDTANDLVKVYRYRLTANEEVSSGTLNAKPIYDYEYRIWEHEGGDEPEKGHSPPDCSQLEYNYLGLTSSASNAFGTSTPISYREVTELHGENGEKGKSIYYFTSHYDRPDGQGGRAYPFSPPTDQSWKRGLLMRQVDFDRGHQPLCYRREAPRLA